MSERVLTPHDFFSHGTHGCACAAEIRTPDEVAPLSGAAPVLVVLLGAAGALAAGICWLSGGSWALILGLWFGMPLVGATTLIGATLLPHRQPRRTDPACGRPDCRPHGHLTGPWSPQGSALNV